MLFTQAEAIARFISFIEEKGQLYSKFAIVEARRADVGERIVTETADGIETHNTAIEGDYVIRNGTRAKEQYILSGKKLAARYQLLEGEAHQIDSWLWNKYQATGKCFAARYVEPSAIEFVASWGETMVLKPGDMICSPHPDKSEVYRIARAEFEQTYR